MSRRGQGTTELALGSLVFVTVLLFGIHFAEVGFAMLKMKEAAQFGVAHAAGQRVHRFSFSNVTSGNPYQPFDPAAAGAAAQARYGGGFRGVLTQLRRVRVRCQADDTVRFEVQRPGGLSPDTSSALTFLRSIYRDRGGVACRATGSISLFRVPEHLADEGAGAFFKAPHASLTDLPVCGVGLPRNGTCSGSLATLTGDWAFEGPLDDEVNDDNPDVRESEINNRPYRAVVEELFDRAGGPYSNATSWTPAQQLMNVGGGVTPAQTEWIDETRFAMSYKGDTAGGPVIITPHQIDPVYNPALSYQTSGADLDNPLVRWNPRTGVVRGVPRCFLGLYGCQQNQTNPN